MSNPERDPFAAGTWEGAAFARLIEESRWPLAKKLAWLEEAQRLADHLQRNRIRPSSEK